AVAVEETRVARDARDERDDVQPDAHEADDDAPPAPALHLELPALRLLAPASLPRDDVEALPERLRVLLAAGPLDEALADEAPDTEERLVDAAAQLARRAYPER